MRRAESSKGAIIRSSPLTDRKAWMLRMRMLEQRKKEEAQMATKDLITFHKSARTPLMCCHDSTNQNAGVSAVHVHVSVAQEGGTGWTFSDEEGGQEGSRWWVGGKVRALEGPSSPPP